MSLLELVQRRLVIVTGKGGVGKTTVATALAQAVARRGRRVLLSEMVPDATAPSQLSGFLGGVRVSEEPTLVSDNLWAVLLTPAKGHLRFLEDTLRLRLLAETAMRSPAVRKFLSAAPGFADMGVMYRLLELMDRPARGGGTAFEVNIVDAPATGHALALAQIPEFLVRVIQVGPIARVARRGLTMLTDPASTSVVVVTLPELLPITEALELHHALRDLRLPVSALVVNRVPHDPFSGEERAALLHALRASTSVFGARELRRIERAEAALAALRSDAPGQSLTLPEVQGGSSEASLALSQAMSQ